MENLESRALESGRQLKESGIPPTIKIRNPSQIHDSGFPYKVDSLFSSSAGWSSPTPTEANAAAAQAGAGGLKNKTLWIVIAAVAGITLIAIIIISVILCKKRSGDDIHRSVLNEGTNL